MLLQNSRYSFKRRARYRFAVLGVGCFEYATIALRLLAIWNETFDGHLMRDPLSTYEELTHRNYIGIIASKTRYDSRSTLLASIARAAWREHTRKSASSVRLGN